MSNKDIKASFLKLMDKLQISPKDLSTITGFSTNYVKNLIYNSKGNAPRWMAIVVEIAKRIENREN